MLVMFGIFLVLGVAFIIGAVLDKCPTLSTFGILSLLLSGFMLGANFERQYIGENVIKELDAKGIITINAEELKSLDYSIFKDYSPEEKAIINAMMETKDRDKE